MRRMYSEKELQTISKQVVEDKVDVMKSEGKLSSTKASGYGFYFEPDENTSEIIVPAENRKWTLYMCTIYDENDDYIYSGLAYHQPDGSGELYATTIGLDFDEKRPVLEFKNGKIKLIVEGSEYVFSSGNTYGVLLQPII